MMKTTKRTFTLSQETMHRFDHTVPRGKRSRLVEGLIHRYLEEDEDAQLDREIAECCQEMADIYAEVQHEFDPIDCELWRNVEF